MSAGGKSPHRFPSGLLLALCGFLLSCGQNQEPPADLLGQVHSLLESGSYPKGVGLANETLKRYPRSKRLRVMLGEAEFTRGHFQEAVDALTPGLKEGLGYTEAARTLGLSHFFLGHWKEARDFLGRIRTARQRNPEEPGHSEVLKVLGYAAYYQRDLEEALSVFEEMRKSPDETLEMEIASDVLRGLLGRQATIPMTWHTDPVSGIRFCVPAGWTRQEGEFPSQFGRARWTRLSGTAAPGTHTFLQNETLFLVTLENASHRPLPELEVLRGYRTDWQFIDLEEREAGGRSLAISPHAEARPVFLKRNPETFARVLGPSCSQWILRNWEMIVGHLEYLSQAVVRGRAVYSWGEMSGVEREKVRWTGQSMGIYDPATDAVIFLLLVGPQHLKREVDPLAWAIFQLALFGGLESDEDRL